MVGGNKRMTRLRKATQRPKGEITHSATNHSGPDGRSYGD